MSKAATNPTAETRIESGTTYIPPRAKLAYAIMLAGVVLLAATGVGTFLVGTPPMTQWILMLHVGAAPLFAAGLVLVAITWSDSCRFSSECAEQGFVSKVLLWIILTSGVVVILAGVLPMTPLFGTDEQHTLYLTHRYSGFVLTATIALHLLSLRMRR